MYICVKVSVVQAVRYDVNPFTTNSKNQSKPNRTGFVKQSPRLRSSGYSHLLNFPQELSEGPVKDEILDALGGDQAGRGKLDEKPRGSAPIEAPWSIR